MAHIFVSHFVSPSHLASFGKHAGIKPTNKWSTSDFWNGNKYSLHFVLGLCECEFMSVALLRVAGMRPSNGICWPTLRSNDRLNYVKRYQRGVEQKGVKYIKSG